jgi:hypothetical protein
MTKKYPAKVSYGLLTFVLLVFFGSLVPSLINGGLNVKLIGFLAAHSLIFAFIAHLFFNTAYTIDNDKLKIKCGVFSYKPIDIEKIREMHNTKSIISSPAPSFDRIVIKYEKFDEIIISPKDKLTFARELMKINPNIKNKISE